MKYETLTLTSIIRGLPLKERLSERSRLQPWLFSCN